MAGEITEKIDTPIAEPAPSATTSNNEILFLRLPVFLVGSDGDKLNPILISIQSSSSRVVQADRRASLHP